ncbi:ribosomal protein L1p/L10e family-domain-containing protein, partial [Phakopsora pachyrhizi]
MINPDQFNLAVETLLKHSSQTLKKKVEDGGLFADDTGTNDCMIHLIISLKRVLSREKHKPIRIDLDHSLIDPRQSGVCLIVKDPQREYKDLMEERKIKFISKVVGITKLKGKHSSFEAKRLLLSSHAMFLADKRLLSILPGILGSKFFQSKKLPVPVDLTEPSKVKERLEKAISSTYLRLGAGSCLAIKVADMSRHSESQIKENLVRVLEQLGKKLPMGGWANIQGVHVKTGTSVSLPIWLADLNEGEFGRFNLTPTTAEQDGRKRAEEKRKDQKELFEKKKQQRNQKRKRSSSEPA